MESDNVLMGFMALGYKTNKVKRKMVRIPDGDPPTAELQPMGD